MQSKLATLLIFIALTACVHGAQNTLDRAPEPADVYVIALNDGIIEQKCTGFLYSQNKIVTAAHCTIGMTRARVFNEDGSDGPKVVKIISHPDFQKYSQYGDDIAVLIIEPQKNPSFSLVDRFGRGDLHTVGYPGGNFKARSNLDVIVSDDNLIMVNGFIMLGMSGSPVFTDNAKIVGVVSFIMPGTEKAGVTHLTDERRGWINEVQ